MSCRTIRRPLRTLSVVAGLALAAPAWAGVHDRARLFSPGAVERAQAKAARIEKSYHVGLVVDTFRTPPGSWLFGPSAGRIQAMDPAARERHFRQVAARRARPDSVYIFLCREPAPPVVEVIAGRGPDVARAFGPADAEELENRLRGLIAQNQYDLALDEAVNFVGQTVVAHRGQEPPGDPFTWQAIWEVVLLLLGVWLLLEAARAVRRGSAPRTDAWPAEALGLGGSVLSGLFAFLAGPIRGQRTPTCAPAAAAEAPLPEAAAVAVTAGVPAHAAAAARHAEADGDPSADTEGGHA